MLNSDSNVDKKIYEFLKNKIRTTTGSEQQQWVYKYDKFTNKEFFKEENRTEDLKEISEIRKEVLKYVE